MGSDPAGNRSHGYFFVLGRAKPGVTRAAAAADMASLASALEREYPADNMEVGVAATPLVDDLVGDVRPMLQLLMTAVGLVLLIATANVSALLIARATSRTQEVAIRLALGASRTRIVAQLLTESVLLAFIGGAAGVLLALWLVAPLVALSPRDFGAAGPVRIDATVLAFAVIVSTAAGIVFGLAPARQLLGVDLHRDLKQSTHGMAAVGQRRLRAALVAGEVALSMVLLVGAGLTIRSFVRVLQVSPGFDASHVVTTTITLPGTPATARRSSAPTSGSGRLTRFAAFPASGPSAPRAGCRCRAATARAASSSTATATRPRRCPPTTARRRPIISARSAFPCSSAAASTTPIATAGRWQRSSARRWRSGCGRTAMRLGITLPSILSGR